MHISLSCNLGILSSGLRFFGRKYQIHYVFGIIPDNRYSETATQLSSISMIVSAM